MVQDYEVTLTQKTEIAPEVWYYRFALAEGQTLDFTAGQYMLLKVDGNYRQYSIASADNIHSSFDLLVETIPGGLGSNYLMNLSVGSTAQFKRPAGVFILKDFPMNKIFLATGTGIAPIKSMIESYFSRESHNATLTLYFGLKNRQGIYLFDEFKELATKYPNFKFKICLSREENLEGLDITYYEMGRVNQHVTNFVQGKHNEYEYYVCGSKLVVDSLREFVLSLGVAPEQVFFERFTI